MIRRYTVSDIDAVLQVWEAASRLAHPWLDEAFLEAERARIRESHMVVAESWVWEEGAEVRAFIALMGDEIGGLFVHPSHHRRGIGRALVQVAWRGRAALEVEVFEANHGACAFYADQGFGVVRKRRDAATGQRVLRMRATSVSRATPEAASDALEVTEGPRKQQTGSDPRGPNSIDEERA